MANIKKYNPETEQWETWASNSASGVYSVNPELLSENEQAITVEEALIRDREDIELMKKNISWLALHGGGGSGGGGGEYVEVNSYIDILDQNNNPTEEFVWKATSKSISYMITSSKSSNKFNVTATLDGYVIYSQSGLSQGVIRSIGINKIGAYSSSSRHILRISAVDSWDNVITKQAVIIESAVKLNRAVDTYTVNIDEVTSGSTLTISYQSSIVGDYVLYWGNSSDLDVNPDHRVGWKELSIRSGFAEDAVIPYWDSEQQNRLLTSPTVKSGQTLTFYFVLISLLDSSIKSDVLEIKSSVISPRELAIQPISLSTEISEATKISKASIMNCNFIVYLNSSTITYDYTITANKLSYNEQTEEWDIVDSKVIIENYSGRYGVVTSVTYNALPRDDFFVGGTTYRFDIFARDRMDLTKYNTAYSYVEIQSASEQTIPLEADYKKIFEFNVWGDKPNEQTWVWNSTNEGFNHNGENKVVSTNASFINMGGKSQVEATYCRLTNKAHAIINKSTLNGEPISWFPTDANSGLSGLVHASSPQFTLSINYYNDFTPDDNRTIFNFGNYIPQTPTNIASGRGILINNHDFYVKIGPNSPLVTGKIQDSIYHEIDIVFGRGNMWSNTNASVEVYHNGVLLAIEKEISTSDIFGLNEFNEMTIGCYKKNSNLSQFTNIKLQGVSFYATALNPFQVVCNWINHLVTYELDNNSLNKALLNQKLQSNLITAHDDGTYSCAIWNILGNDYDVQNWIEIKNGQLYPEGSLHSICPIPIVILDLSTKSTWTIERFKQSWANSQQSAAEGVPIYFYNPLGGSKVFPDNTLVTVTGQGTTSKAYAIKNLNIDFGENNLFWAKQEWFPERTFTLKADIVDSAHANNACIGKFVNTCAQNTTLLAPTPPMQYFNDNKLQFELPQSAVGESGVSIKHTLEGFPVLLLVKFPTASGTTVNQSLGIYSFNLGREAYYNMGFKVLKRFRDVDGQLLSETAKAPILLGKPDESSDVIDFDAQSWEGKDSFNCSPKTSTTISAINSASNGGYDTSVNATMPIQLDGYFWSSYPNHIKHFWENKYPGGANVADFQLLCRDLVQCPYTKGSSNIEVGSASVYQYDWDGSKMYVPDQTTGAITIKRLNKDTPPINIPNARFYYVISMLFGLVDSLGKNLNMRIWKNTHLQEVSPIWYTCFYDMDTAMGIDNAGAEIVKPDVLDEELYNDPELIRKLAYGTYGNEKMYTVRDNKLWGILDHPTFKDQYGASGGVGGGIASRESLYAAVWNFLRTNYLKSADDFMNTYFDNQTDGVGELLYNQDFDVKYVNTPQSSYMYGDRKAFVRDWITKRIKFLDSYFGYLQRSGSEPFLEDVNIEDCSYKNIIKLKHQSGVEYIPVVTNAPCVITTTIGGQTNNSYYVPANTPTNIRVANSVGTSGIQTQINNSDLLLELRDLSELSIQSIESTETKSIDTGGEYVDNLYSKQYGSLSSFTKFDASNNRTFENNGIDFIQLFKTWNRGENTLPYTLTELDLSNTANSSVTQFQLNLKSNKVGLNGANYYQNPFENLTDINIVNSCVTGVTLPENIALNSLQVAGSAIEEIDLNGQSILKTIDFSNCIALNSVSLNNCSAFETLTLNGLPLLRYVHITKCSSLREVNINMNGNESPIRVIIDEVPNLKKISITNSHSEDTVVIINASGLEDLSFYGCTFSHFVLSSSCKNTIKSLDLSYSSVRAINWDKTEIDLTENVIDLADCPLLVQGGINIKNNIAIENIQLPNNNGSPVNLNFEFTGCTNLTRIYGNLNLNKAAMFKDCTKFKVHGGTFNNTSVKNGSVQLYLGDTAIAGKRLADVFQTGKGVTNLTINITSPTTMFENTAVDAFDVYYILRHLGPNVRNISGMFQNCTNIKMNCVNTSTDNSPHWTMFEKSALVDGVCRITNVSSLFYNSNIGPFRLYGNHTGEYSDAHSGLLTPLVNCTNFQNMFGRDNAHSNPFICDKNIFTLAEGQYYGGRSATININYFRPNNVYVDVNKMNVSQAYYACTSPSNSSLSGFERGNIKGIFDHFGKLPSSLVYVMDGLGYLNYGGSGAESDTMIRFPLEVTSFEHCFNAGSTSGSITLQRLFTRNNNNEFDVTSIVNSFGGSGGAVFGLDNYTLKGFTKLHTWNGAFGGVSKQVISDTFPYDIFDDCANTITTLTSFFANATHQNLTETVVLPGRLFLKCKNLSNITSCFNSFNIPFKLEAGGFINCTKLRNVTTAFANIHSSYPFPNHFFDTGFVDSTKTIIGAGISEKTMEVEGTWSSNEFVVTTETEEEKTIKRYKNVHVDRTTMTYYPISTYSGQLWIKSEGTWMLDTTWTNEPVATYEEWDPTEEVVQVHRARKSISNISNCFVHSNFPVYDHELNLDSYENGGDVEPNPSYCPFDYIYDNDHWTTTTRDDKKWTFMWNFDGVWTDMPENMEDYVLDDEEPYDLKANDNAFSAFAFPPDLFRWCQNTVNLTGVFNAYSFKGRICPYWLKPIPDVTTIESMFANCSNITAYSNNENRDIYVTIPKTFFSYAVNITNLKSAFSHTNFFSGGPLSEVFGYLRGYLDIEAIFYGCHWRGGTSSNRFQLNGVFSSNKITNARSAFNGSYSTDTRQQYVQFNNMFSKNKQIHPESADYYVFYGYQSGYAVHETTKTCSQLASRKNYEYYTAS